MTDLLPHHSLGVVLLEIGLWQPLSTFRPTVSSAEYLRDELVEMAKTELPGQVGKIYSKVVVTCLSVKEEEKDADVQQLLYWNVVTALDGCNA